MAHLVEHAESWLPVVGFEGIYEVSDYGRVRSLDRTTPRTQITPSGRRLTQLIPIKGRELVLSIDKNSGYLKVGLKGRTRPIHRIVLDAFVGPLPAGGVTRHLDGVKTNNHIENLVYGTYSENQIDQVEAGTHCHTRRTECAAGHAFSPENTVHRSNPANGRYRRVCRICERARGDRYRKRRRANAEAVAR
jgi:NUMOD4 motif/HNH endonuclease